MVIMSTKVRPTRPDLNFSLFKTERVLHNPLLNERIWGDSILTETGKALDSYRTWRDTVNWLKNSVMSNLCVLFFQFFFFSTIFCWGITVDIWAEERSKGVLIYANSGHWLYNLILFCSTARREQWLWCQLRNICSWWQKQANNREIWWTSRWMVIYRPT